MTVLRFRSGRRSGVGTDSGSRHASRRSQPRSGGIRKPTPQGVGITTNTIHRAPGGRHARGGADLARAPGLRFPVPTLIESINQHAVVTVVCTRYVCDRTEPTLYVRGSNPLATGSSAPPECQLGPWQGLCSPRPTRLPTASSNQIRLPVQFLYARVQLAVALRQLIGLLAQIRDRQCRDKLHLGFRIAVLAC